tara:strand:- start:3896 stop:4801 length:906 start_codon:yes stop_codon:yes gene_type:complete
MKILILGNSSIFQRKIFPSLVKFKKLSLEVASKRKNDFNKDIKTYKSYKDSIKKTEAKIVYISLINSEHFKWALFALKNDKHVIIDKPFTLKLKETKTLINHAFKKKLFLSEAVVFHEHLRFKNLLKKININKKTNILASFHIPKLNKTNFRNHQKYGGGCFNDMSTYAAYLIYLFIGKKKYKLKKINKEKNLNEFFSLSANSRLVKITASFKFNAEYKNQIIIENNSKKYSINYAFSPPIDKKTNIIVQFDKKKEYKLNFKKQNTFDIYFSNIFNLIKKNKYKFFYEEIEKISKIKQKIY